METIIRLIISLCLFITSAAVIVANNKTSEILLCIIIWIMLALLSGFAFYYLLIKNAKKFFTVRTESHLIVLPVFVGMALFLLGIESPATIIPNFFLFLSATISMTGIAKMEYQKFYPR